MVACVIMQNEAFLDYPENEILYSLNRKKSEQHSDVVLLFWPLLS